MRSHFQYLDFLKATNIENLKNGESKNNME